MSDLYSDTEARPYLSADEVRATPLIEVRKGGVDPAVIVDVIARSAVTIDALYATIDTLQAALHHQLEANDQASEDQNGPVAASRLLEAAARTADAVVAEATAEAAALAAAADHAHQDQTARMAGDLAAHQTHLAQLDTELAASQAVHADALAAAAAQHAQALLALQDQSRDDLARLTAEVGSWHEVISARRVEILAAVESIKAAVTVASAKSAGDDLVLPADLVAPGIDALDAPSGTDTPTDGWAAEADVPAVTPADVPAASVYGNWDQVPPTPSAPAVPAEGPFDTPSTWSAPHDEPFGTAQG